MSIPRTSTDVLVRAVATIALGAAAGATAYLVMPTASAVVGDDATRASASPTAATADEKGPSCGPFGGWAAGDRPAWVEDRLDDLPDELRSDLEEAWQVTDPVERRDALRAIWRAAKDGEYGDEVQELVEDGPAGRGWGPGNGWGPGAGWHGGRGPWSR